MIAEGVSGGVNRSNESVVVCDLRRVVVALRISRGLGVGFGADVEASWCCTEIAEEFDLEVEDEEGGVFSDETKCASRSCVVFVRSMSARISFALFAALAFGGIVSGGLCDLDGRAAML